MKLDSKQLRNGYNHYTQQEVDYIVNNYKVKKIKQIATDLSRTECSISAKIQALGLAKARRNAVKSSYNVISTKKSSVVIDITNVKLSDGLELFKALGKFQYKIV